VIENIKAGTFIHILLIETRVIRRHISSFLGGLAQSTRYKGTVVFDRSLPKDCWR